MESGESLGVNTHTEVLMRAKLPSLWHQACASSYTGRGGHGGDRAKWVQMMCESMGPRPHSTGETSLHSSQLLQAPRPPILDIPL